MRNIRGYLTNLWVIKNPVILYRIMRGFFRAFVLGRKTLKTIEIFPTLRCNLECTMCSVQKYKNSRRPLLGLEDYERIASEGGRMGAIAVNILGGEPLLASDLREIIEIFKRNHYFILIVSNALLVTREKLKELREAGLDSICFSLDNLDPSVNDEIRGMDGHHQRVFEAVEMAKKEGLIVSLAPVFFPGKIDKGLEVVKYCEEHGLGASGTQVGAVGAWEDGKLLAPEEHNQIRAMLKHYPRFTLDWALSYDLTYCCPAGKEKVGITSFGDVVGCSINPLAFGNVKEEPLQTIWERMGRFSQYRKDSPVCLSAEDTAFVETYLRPLKVIAEYPVHYGNHPAITPENEQELFGIKPEKN
jgi:MoaA/NifB/PqqE/SkfB family radical SAM enzyme